MFRSRLILEQCIFVSSTYRKHIVGGCWCCHVSSTVRIAPSFVIVVIITFTPTLKQHHKPSIQWWNLPVDNKSRPTSTVTVPAKCRLRGVSERANNWSASFIIWSWRNESHMSKLVKLPECTMNIASVPTNNQQLVVPFTIRVQSSSIILPDDCQAVQAAPLTNLEKSEICPE